MVTPYIFERHSKNTFSTKVSKTCSPTHYIFTQKDLRRIYDIHNNYRPDLFFIKQWSGIGKHDYKAIGPKEVDYNYYSTWEGENRTFVMDKRTYEKFFKPNAIESLSLELRKYINN